MSEYYNSEYVKKNNETKDKVFLLSVEEVNKYFDSDNSRMCKSAVMREGKEAKANCTWWLRSTVTDSYLGLENDRVAVVNCRGVVDEGGYPETDDNIAVRPALWIDLNSYIEYEAEDQCDEHFLEISIEE